VALRRSQTRKNAWAIRKCPPRRPHRRPCGEAGDGIRTGQGGKVKRPGGDQPRQRRGSVLAPAFCTFCVQTKRVSLQVGPLALEAVSAGGWLGGLAMSSASFDLVKAVRVDGKPRHEFVLSFGSQKNADRSQAPTLRQREIEDTDLCRFWVRATDRMIRHGLTRAQRRRLIAELIRKGARVPPVAAMQEHGADQRWPYIIEAVNEFLTCLEVVRAEAVE
jgi:hypothetical protein